MILRRLRIAVLGVVFAVVMAGTFGAGFALGHSYSCWTAYPEPGGPFPVTCGPRNHLNNANYVQDPAYSFDMTTRVQQNQLGSFYWLDLTLSNGVEYCCGPNQFGLTYIFTNTGGTVYTTNWWMCRSVGQTVYSQISPGAWNSTVSGYWEQRSTNSDCGYPTPYYDYWIVSAY